MKETRSQKRMWKCWEIVGKLPEADKASSDKDQFARAYHAAIKKTVSHIYTHGLEMALLFLRSRSGPEAKRGYKDISSCCVTMLGASGDLLEYLNQQPDRVNVMRATQETVEIIGIISCLLRGKGIEPEDGGNDEATSPSVEASKSAIR